MDEIEKFITDLRNDMKKTEDLNRQIIEIKDDQIDNLKEIVNLLKERIETKDEIIYILKTRVLK